VREGEPVDELPIRGGLLDRVEVLALEVLDQGKLELLASRRLPDDRRDARRRRSPAISS
jgi:hypothetical protein